MGSSHSSEPVTLEMPSGCSVSIANIQLTGADLSFEWGCLNEDEHEPCVSEQEMEELIIEALGSDMAARHNGAHG